MESTNEVKERKPTDGRPIQAYFELITRAMLASRLGTQQYRGDRDIYKALGYKTEIEFDDYYARYSRQDIAKAIIDRPVGATWQGTLELVESNEPKETTFEKEWRMLDRTLGVKTRLARVDRLTGIGRYGVLLLGLDDVRSIESLASPVKTGTRKLLYIRPFSETTAKIAEFEKTTTNVRYGLPLFYTITLTDEENKSKKEVKVHHSRIIHITDDNLESEVYGTPRLEAVFNRLFDLEKLVGGDAEMFWRNARPGFAGKVDPSFTVTPEMKKALNEQFDEYENYLRRFLINEGFDLEPLSQQVADPSHHVDVQLQMISAQTGIPKRILTGSERGELSSSEDRGEWLTYVQARREEHAEPRILRPFVDRIIELGILPKPSDEYSVKWIDLFSLSEKARVEIGKSRANALREYTTNPISQAIIPPSAFMEFFLGLSTDQIELVSKIREDEMQEEVELMAKIKEELEPTPPPSGGDNDVKPKSETGEARKKKTINPEGPKRRVRQPV